MRWKDARTYLAEEPELGFLLFAPAKLTGDFERWVKRGMKDKPAKLVDFVMARVGSIAFVPYHADFRTRSCNGGGAKAALDGMLVETRIRLGAIYKTGSDDMVYPCSALYQVRIWEEAFDCIRANDRAAQVTVLVVVQELVVRNTRFGPSRFALNAMRVPPDVKLIG